MFKRYLIASLWCLLLSVDFVSALEFKNFGTVGMGGAGVAKPPAGTEGYWNPAALGIQEEGKAFHSSLLVSASSKGNLIDDLDRLNTSTSVRTQPNLPNGPGITESWDWIHSGMADTIVIDAPILSMGRSPGNVVRAGGGLAIGQKVGRWGVGYYGSVMSTVHSDSDLVNILPDEDEVHPMTIAGFNAFGAQLPRGPSSTFFSAAQAVALEHSLVGFGVTPSAAYNIRNALDYRFSVSNALHMKPEEVAAVLIDMVRVSASGSGDLIAHNQTLITTNALILNEVPFSYGRPFDLGGYGKVAVGISAKLMMARLYTSTFRAFMTDIETVYRRLADTYQDSINFGVDLGVIWSMEGVSVGVMAKNLNSPRFDRAGGGALAVRPSVRGGINYEPLDWLRAAVDIDLTESSELTPLTPIRMLGGGIELKPYGWSLVRVGSCWNIASDESPAVTAGLGYDDGAVNISVDGAYGLGKAAFRGSTYTNEVQLQLAFGMRFD